MGIFGFFKKKQPLASSPKANPSRAPFPPMSSRVTIKSDTVTVGNYHGPFSYYQFSGTTEEYFDLVYRQASSEYTIERNVQPSRIDAWANPDCAIIPFLFYRDGRPVLAVTLPDPQRYKNRRILGTVQFCERNGIRFLRFFDGWRNEAEYVINRTRENL